MTESISRKFSKLGPHVSATGTITTNAATASAWETARTLTLSGDVSGNVSIDGSENVTLTATVSGNSVALGTDTTGDYVASITNGNYITGGNGGSEGATLTLAVDATSDNTASKVVARDASGNFSAGTITATLSGNATTATTWATGRTIALTGDVTGTSGAFDGSGNISISTTIAADSVALGTDTTGDYVAAVAVSGTGLSVSGSGENATYTITSNATSTNTASTIVARDASGNFTAGTITATLSGSSTSTDLINSVGITGNLDTMYQARTFGWEPSTNGRPTDQYGQGIAVVSAGNTHNNTNNWITQLGFGTNMNTAYFRTKVNTDSWGAWHTLIHSGNYTSYSPSLTGTGASGTWGINITGNANNITQYTVNQSVGTGNSPTFYNLYANQWFRNNTANTGLYNESTTQHWSSAINGYWDASSTNTVSGIRFYTGGHVSALRGYVYADTSNSIGFLNSGGNWRLRVIGDDYTQVDGSSIRASLYYDLNDTTYYFDGNSTGTSINVRGEIQNPSVWINDGDNYNAYNENIRLFNAPNGVSVIAFSASGTSGSPTTSILGFGDRHEVRFNDGWQTRIYNGYAEAAGSYRAPIFYDSNNTAYYCDPNGTARLSYVVANGGIRIDGNENLYLDNNYGQSIVGVYTSTRYQGVFAMGNAYKLPIDGSGPGNLYGLTWSHPNAGGVAGNLNTHGLMALENGSWLASLCGSTRARDDMRAPIFYDNNNTGYYTDPASTSNLNALLTYSYQGNGNIGGTGNAAWFPSGLYVASGLPAWLYGPIYRNGQNTFGGGTAEYTIVYDNNDSNYYVDPNGTSRLNRVDPNEIYNHGWFRNLGDSGWYSQAYGYGAWWAQSGGNSYGNATTYGTGRNGWSGWGIGSRHVFMSTTGDNVGVHDNSRGWIWYWNGSYTEFPFGYTIHGGSSRSPIFYDQNDTNWYCDPNSTSRFWTLSLENRLYIYGGNPGDPGSDTTPQVFFKTGGGMGLSSIETDFWTGFTGSSYPNNFQIGFRMAYDKRLYVWQDLVQYYSDERLKEKTGTLAGALDAIKAWTPFKYVDNALANSFNFGSGRTQIGLSAQEVQQYYPELVELAPFDVQNDFSDETNPRRVSKSGENYLTLNYTRLVPVLIQAIKEQQAKIEELERRINNS